MNTPYHFFVNTCDASVEDFLTESFPGSKLNDDESIVIDGVEYYYEPVEVANMNEVSNCLRLYKLYIFVQ